MSVEDETEHQIGKPAPWTFTSPLTQAANGGAAPPFGTITQVGGVEPSSGEAHAVVTGGDTLVEAPPDDRPRRKIAIVGYTTSREETPYDDPSWEKWGMNNLHNQPDIAAHVGQFSRWYNLHDLGDLERPLGQGGDPPHLAWLREPHPFPIYVMDPMENVTADGDGDPLASVAERYGFPSAVPFPKTQLLSQFMRYFTNTVSWQIAHAIWEALLDESYVFSDLALFGIDMATGTEYAAQRPSVEYFLGLAQGLGVQLHIPETSDILKAAQLYGGEDEQSGMRAKVDVRLRELHGQREAIVSQLEEGHRILASVEGAIDAFAYIQGVWLPPRAEAGQRDKVVLPGGALTQVAKVLAEGDANDRHKKE